MSTALLTLYLGFGLATAAGDPQPVPSALQALHSADAKPFMPGVRINWQAREVEVAGVVVLREGMLELFACSPDTREHESIVRISARPTHVYQAQGLLGLEPGSPPRWDPEMERGFAATGPRLRLRVRYQRDGRTHTHGIHKWMWNIMTDEPASPTQWVFSGSLREDPGRLAADFEGTVVCVVDFQTALISLPQSYSDRNEDLWLRPHAERIPPLGTHCVLLIQAVPESLRIITIGRYGGLTLDGRRVGRVELAGQLAQDMSAHPDLTIEVIADPAALQADIEAILKNAERVGVPTERCTVTREDPEPAADLKTDAIITLLNRPVDAPSGVFHNIRAALLAVSSRLSTIAESVSRGTESLRGFLQAADDPGAGDWESRRPVEEPESRARSTSAGTPARNE